MAVTRAKIIKAAYSVGPISIPTSSVLMVPLLSMFSEHRHGGTSGPRGVASYDQDADNEESNEALLEMTPENALESFEELAWSDRPDESALVQDEIAPVLIGWYAGNPGAGASALPIPFLASTANDSDRAKLRITALVDGSQESPQSITLEYALLP